MSIIQISNLLIYNFISQKHSAPTPPKFSQIKAVVVGVYPSYSAASHCQYLPPSKFLLLFSEVTLPPCLLPFLFFLNEFILIGG